MSQSEFEPIQLPENYNGAFSLESLLPGDVVFVYAHTLKQDSEGRGLFLNKETGVDDDNINPSYFPQDKLSDKVGVMRVYQEIGGTPVDGYVVDITDVKPGAIGREKIMPVAGDSEFDQSYLKSQQNKWSQVIGLRYKDAEGVVHFQGPEWLEDSATYLGEVFEAKRAKDKALPREGSMPETELLDKIEQAKEVSEPVEEAEQSPPEPVKDKDELQPHRGIARVLRKIRK